MRIVVKVKTNARKNEVKEIEHGILQVSVSVPPIEGKANQKVIELLAKHFNYPKSKLSIIVGHKAKTKVVELL